jgi:excisionase family DNA binding protein
MNIPDKELFSPADIAPLLDLCPNTVVKLIDRGTIRGYQVPGSKHRRVTRESLARFLRSLESIKENS